MPTKKTHAFNAIVNDLAAVKAAIEKQTFTKARTLINRADEGIAIAEQTGGVTEAEAISFENELHAMWRLLPKKPRKLPKKSKRELEREAHARFLYRNNTYTPGS